MKDLFINWETALKLKELGFNYPCFAVYDKKGNLEEDVSVDWNTIDKMNNSQPVTSAPLIYQVFKFFRDKYNLSCFISQDWKDAKLLGFDATIESFDGELIESTKTYKTYEKAELEAINYLIKICCK